MAIPRPFPFFFYTLSSSSSSSSSSVLALINRLNNASIGRTKYSENPFRIIAALAHKIDRLSDDENLVSEVYWYEGGHHRLSQPVPEIGLIFLYRFITENRFFIIGGERNTECEAGTEITVFQ